MDVLEAARLSGNNPMVLYSSTNKVYGDLEHLQVIEGNSRYFAPDTVACRYEEFYRECVTQIGGRLL